MLNRRYFDEFNDGSKDEPGVFKQLNDRKKKLNDHSKD